MRDGERAHPHPWLTKATTLERIECAVTEKETAPPKPYTEGTLIADMASIAKYVTDPEVKAILKQKDDGKKGEHGGIGTTATRASIIEKLKERGYLEDVKGKIRSTDKARAFYHLLPPEIRGADVTARWWLIQQDIADGKADVNDLQRSVIEVFNGHRETAYVGREHRAQGHSRGQVPHLRRGRGSAQGEIRQALLYLLLEQEREAGGRDLETGRGLRIQAAGLVRQDIHAEAGRIPARRQDGTPQGLQVQDHGQNLRLQGEAQEGRYDRADVR